MPKNDQRRCDGHFWQFSLHLVNKQGVCFYKWFTSLLMEKMKGWLQQVHQSIIVKWLKSLSSQILLVSKTFLPLSCTKKRQSAKFNSESQIDAKINGVLFHGFSFPVNVLLKIYAIKVWLISSFLDFYSTQCNTLFLSNFHFYICQFFNFKILIIA